MIKLSDLATYSLMIETAEGAADTVTDAWIEEAKDGEFVRKEDAAEMIADYVTLLCHARIEIEEAKDRILELEEKVAGHELDDGK